MIMKVLSLVLLFLYHFSAGASPPKQETITWRGLVVAPEDRCLPYARAFDYPHEQSVEDVIIYNMDGRIYSPYTGEYFESKKETDIEHIIGPSEAHDSGLCKAPRKVKRAFAMDPLNLTLADPHLNRRIKKAHDASGWTPELNRCWFAHTVVAVRLKYNLTVDRAEAGALEEILSDCDSADYDIYYTDGGEDLQSKEERKEAACEKFISKNQDLCRIEVQNYDITPWHITACGSWTGENQMQCLLNADQKDPDHIKACGALDTENEKWCLNEYDENMMNYDGYGLDYTKIKACGTLDKSNEIFCLNMDEYLDRGKIRACGALDTENERWCLENSRRFSRKSIEDCKILDTENERQCLESKLSLE